MMEDIPCYLPVAWCWGCQVLHSSSHSQPVQLHLSGLTWSYGHQWLPPLPAWSLPANFLMVFYAAQSCTKTLRVWFILIELHWAALSRLLQISFNIIIIQLLLYITNGSSFLTWMQYNSFQSSSVHGNCFLIHVKYLIIFVFLTDCTNKLKAILQEKDHWCILWFLWHHLVGLIKSFLAWTECCLGMEQR